MANELTKKRCSASTPSTPVLSEKEIHTLLKQIPNWCLNTSKGEITRDFKFKNYEETIAFVNQIASLSRAEDHHPYLEVFYNHCTVHFSTHSVNGLTENDFICAAKVDQMFENA